MLKCLHPPEHVTADILEGDAHGLFVQWCRLCGAYRRGFEKQKLIPAYGDWHLTIPDTGAEVVELQPCELVVTNRAIVGGCTCRDCLKDKKSNAGWPLESTIFVVCETCGNKRCPKADNHRHKCTGSNEPGQVAELEQA